MMASGFNGEKTKKYWYKEEMKKIQRKNYLLKLDMIKTGEAKPNQDLNELGLSRHESKINMGNIEFTENESY